LDELQVQLDRARTTGVAAACYKEERRIHLPRSVLLAIASRETGCEDVIGDGGHGRGVFQIDDRFHYDWLVTHGAAEPGRTPPLRAAARLAALLVAQGLGIARNHGLKGDDAVRFAAASYNAGVGGALVGLRRGDPDLETTGGDYGADVISRMHSFRALQAAERAEHQRTE
jgi:hypothetical protein